jgi:hypothetical protein
VKVKAWMQMGCERREVTFEVTAAEMAKVGEDGLEMDIEETVLDWIHSRYGWGWSCDRMTKDFSSHEDLNSPSLCVTEEILNPRTKRLLVTPRNGPGSQIGVA